MQDSTTFISFHSFEELLGNKSIILAFQGLMHICIKISKTIKVAQNNFQHIPRLDFDGS